MSKGQEGGGGVYSRVRVRRGSILMSKGQEGGSG